MDCVQVKLLDLDRQKHRVEVKKRILPERDYSYDEMQISNTEKRLGANIASFYLQRKMRYPTRLRSVSDISTTPLVRQARQALKLQDVSRSTDGAISERSHTARTVSSVAATPSAASPVRPALLHRRDSRSAPSAAPKRCHSARYDREETHLPAISGQEMAGQEAKTKPGHVKFMFQDPMKILTADDPLRVAPIKDVQESAVVHTRPFTYHPGMEQHRERFQSRDLVLDMSDDDDDPSLPDRIDLRALLFDGEGSGEDAPSVKSPAKGSQVPPPALRRSNTFAAKITQDLIQHENDQVQDKVDRFLQQLDDFATRQYDSDSDVDLEDHTVFARPRPATVQAPPTQPAKASTYAATTATDDTSEETSSRRKPRLEESKTPQMPKDAWRFIKGRGRDGALKGTYSAEDLVLQTLTGVPLNRSLTAGVPLHAAGRAMRHTATFKMRKIVERLVNDRTRYQQHEIEELKRRMEQGMDLLTAAASLAAAPTPAPAPPGRQSQMEPMPALSRNQSRLGSIGGLSRTASRMDTITQVSQEANS